MGQKWILEPLFSKTWLNIDQYSSLEHSLTIWLCGQVVIVVICFMCYPTPFVGDFQKYIYLKHSDVYGLVV